MKELLILLIGLSQILILQMLRNILGTFRTIAIQRNKQYISTLFLAISEIVGIVATVTIVKGFSTSTTIAYVLGSSIGHFIAMNIANKVSKDRLYIHHYIQCEELAKNEIKDIISKLKLLDEEIIFTAQEEFVGDEKLTGFLIYTETKSQSKKIDVFFESIKEFKKAHIVRG